jgi:hypothetical protein
VELLEEWELELAPPPPRVGTTDEDLFFRLEAYSLRDIFFRCCCWRLAAEAVLGLGLGCLTSRGGGGRRGVELFAPPMAAEDEELGEEMFAALRGATRLDGVAAGLVGGTVMEVGVTAVSGVPSTSAFV